jgi:hypothetical protein
LVEFVKGFHLETEGGGVLPVLFLDLSEELFPALVETGEISGGLGESALEVVSSPLDGVFDLIGEVLEGAEGDAFLRGVDDIGVADGGVGDDDLGVALGAESARLEQGFLEPHALSIYILPSLHVIHCINHEVEVGPEVIIEDAFILSTHSQLDRLKVSLGVDDSTHSAGSFTLVGAHVFSAEKELSVEVADLDVVVISDCDFAALC